MTELQLVLSGEEREYLVELLKTVLKDKRVEEHRTRAPDYRAHILQQEKLMSGMLRKLEEAAAQVSF